MGDLKVPSLNLPDGLLGLPETFWKLRFRLQALEFLELSHLPEPALASLEFPERLYFVHLCTRPAKTSTWKKEEGKPRCPKGTSGVQDVWWVPQLLHSDRHVHGDEKENLKEQREHSELPQKPG